MSGRKTAAVARRAIDIGGGSATWAQNANWDSADQTTQIPVLDWGQSSPSRRITGDTQRKICQSRGIVPDFAAERATGTQIQLTRCGKLTVPAGEIVVGGSKISASMGADLITS
jgi:hypothetical protein